MEIAKSMIHFGILKGFLLGLLIITFGWIGIGFVEVAAGSSWSPRWCVRRCASWEGFLD